MKIAHYSVFAAAPGGGKQFAIVEGVDNPVEMQRIAAESGQPLTGFILNAGAELVEARFFSPTKEKGASDSGALVVGEHLRQLGRVGDRLTVQMGDEGLEVFYDDGNWWSHQEDTFGLRLFLEKEHYEGILNALSLSWEDVESNFFGCGNRKKNYLLQFNSERELNSLQPNSNLLSEYNKSHGINGFIGLFVKSPQQVFIRFFAPNKNIDEDNAGSFTLASVCSYLTHLYNFPDNGEYEIEGIQGVAMNRPSRLLAHFFTKDLGAKHIRVGGKVKLLEVSHA